MTTHPALREAAQWCRKAIDNPNYPAPGALSNELGSLAEQVADLLDAVAGLDRLGGSIMRSRDHALRAGATLAGAILKIVHDAEEATDDQPDITVEYTPTWRPIAEELIPVLDAEARELRDVLREADRELEPPHLGEAFQRPGGRTE